MVYAVPCISSHAIERYTLLCVCGHSEWTANAAKQVLNRCDDNKRSLLFRLSPEKTPEKIMWLSPARTPSLVFAGMHMHSTKFAGYPSKIKKDRYKAFKTP